MDFKDVSLPPVTDPLLKLLREYYGLKYQELHGQSAGKGFYSNHDWRRIQFALGLLDPAGGSILDVGVGPAALLNYLQISARHTQITGVDMRAYRTKLIVDDATDFRLMNAMDLQFEDGAFDTVVCMEVLEHIPGEGMMTALQELRRVAKKQLIVSVPFDEPKPLPSYHHQHYDADRLAEIFPDAELTLLQRPKRNGWPWAFAVERF